MTIPAISEYKDHNAFQSLTDNSSALITAPNNHGHQTLTIPNTSTLRNRQNSMVTTDAMAQENQAGLGKFKLEILVRHFSSNMYTVRRCY